MIRYIQYCTYVCNCFPVVIIKTLCIFLLSTVPIKYQIDFNSYKIFTMFNISDAPYQQNKFNLNPNKYMYT